VDSAHRDTEATIVELPHGKNVIVSVAAVNDAGEGPVAVSAPFFVA